MQTVQRERDQVCLAFNLLALKFSFMLLNSVTSPLQLAFHKCRRKKCTMVPWFSCGNIWLALTGKKEEENSQERDQGRSVDLQTCKTQTIIQMCGLLMLFRLKQMSLRHTTCNIKIAGHQCIQQSAHCFIKEFITQTEVTL